MNKLVFAGLVLGVTCATGVASASEAYISQIGGPRVTISAPPIEAVTPEIDLHVPAPQMQLGDLSQLFGSYVLPSATAGENRADLWQTGDDNIGAMMQVGDANASLLSQTGNRNVARSVQMGSFNRSAVYQTGNGFSAGVSQTGNHNSAMIIQSN